MHNFIVTAIFDLAYFDLDHPVLLSPLEVLSDNFISGLVGKINSLGNISTQFHSCLDNKWCAQDLIWLQKQQSPTANKKTSHGPKIE